MSLTIGIIKENIDKRVAITPDNIKRSKLKETTWWIETGAGIEAGFEDAKYNDLAQVKDRSAILTGADIIVSIFPPTESDLASVNNTGLFISQFRPYQDDTVMPKLSQFPFKVLSMDMIPRTTLAQAMDVLSSMASIAGYKAVLLAAQTLPRYFPMMITSAGSIRPAKILIIGA